jgi:hypothetical protein
VPRAEPSPDLTTLAADIAIARKLAVLLDSKFSLFGIRFGFDPILGMLPFVGDGVTALLGSYTIYLAYKHRLGKRVILMMLANLAIDWAVGSVPALGDVFDVAFKAHLRNLAILERATKKL